jgi:diadenosine tetraphosphate (Ap4A) HIT family hydrolase
VSLALDKRRLDGTGAGVACCIDATGIMTSIRHRDPGCSFCAGHLSSSQDPHDRVLATGPRVRLLPTLGMLTPGHLLITTNDHMLSMADLGSAGLADLTSWLAHIGCVLAELFGQYLFFEHGTSTQDGSSTCIEHAHIHLLPLADQLNSKLKSALDWTTLPSYEHLAKYASHSYLYLGFTDSHFVCVKPAVGSQWIRRQVAQALGRDDWDWCLTDDGYELERTLKSIEPRLERLTATF